MARRLDPRIRLILMLAVLSASAWLLVSGSDELRGSEAPRPEVSTGAPLVPAVAIERAIALREEGELEAARDLLEPLPRENTQARYELGMTLLELDELDLAEEHLDAVIEVDPENAEFVFGLAQVVGMQATQTGNPLKQFSLGTRSKKLLDRAIELDGTLVDARFGRMLFYVIAPSLIGGGIERARAEAEEIAAVDEVHGLFARGWIAEEDEEYARAEELHAKAIEKDPTYTHARFRLGYLLLGQERCAEAKVHFEVCWQLEPRDPRSHQGLARCLLGLGDVDGAIRNHEHALSLAQDFSPSIFGLGQCHAKKGDEVRAREYYERFLEYGDEGRSADEARAWLAKHAAR